MRKGPGRIRQRLRIERRYLLRRLAGDGGKDGRRGNAGLCVAAGSHGEVVRVEGINLRRDDLRRGFQQPQVRFRAARRGRKRPQRVGQLHGVKGGQQRHRRRRRRGEECGGVDALHFGEAPARICDVARGPRAALQRVRRGLDQELQLNPVRRVRGVGAFAELLEGRGEVDAVEIGTFAFKDVQNGDRRLRVFELRVDRGGEGEAWLARRGEGHFQAAFWSDFGLSHRSRDEFDVGGLVDCQKRVAAAAPRDAVQGHVEVAHDAHQGKGLADALRRRLAGEVANVELDLVLLLRL
mmetsp:Transcript_25042/g.84154  ORF Transcript_25042/g.84154 Transcript_25042/m.84154 type:complete len:295 (+) Transcript_25042:763-1647(+)